MKMAEFKCSRFTLIQLDEEQKQRSKDFPFSKWNKRELTWRVTKFPKNTLTEKQVLDTISEALEMWAQYCPLKFIFLEEGTVDMVMLFDSGHHGDEDPFDGADGTLAHAFPPKQGAISGDIHFDDSEHWTVGYVREEEDGVDLLQVAVHEIGHALGLDHSEDPSAIMFPSYKEYKQTLDLAQDDIMGIQALYGPLGSGPVDKTEKAREENPSSCSCQLM